MPYSPIHDDDIAAQLEPLLDAATVPATIVNWCGDAPVSVQEWSAFFGELLGVDAEVAVTEVPGASVGSVGDPTKRIGDHRAVSRSTGETGSAAWPSSSCPIGCRGDRPVPDVRGAARPQAASEAGLDDFGPGDFREGLDVLLESLERDSDLSDDGVVRVTADLRRRLVNRLEVEAWYREHPEIEQLPVRGPVDINGLPRSGHDGAGQHALARPAVPVRCAAGSRPSRARRRCSGEEAHRSAGACRRSPRRRWSRPR